jgi:hypothetical protein
MENQNEFKNKNWQERNGMPGNQESSDAENNIFEDAGAEDDDIGPVSETVHHLPEEDDNEGDNRFMDNEEETTDPLETDLETEEEDELLSDDEDDFEEVDEEEEE